MNGRCVRAQKIVDKCAEGARYAIRVTISARISGMSRLCCWPRLHTTTAENFGLMRAARWRHIAAARRADADMTAACFFLAARARPYR